MLNKYLIIYILFIFIPKVDAQVIHINDLDSLWHFKLSATGSYIDGNSPRTLLTNKLKLTKVVNSFGLISNFAYQYGTATSKKYIVYNDFRFENTLLIKPKNSFCPFVRTFTEKNIIRQIDFRNEIAVGVLYKLINKKEQRVNILFAGVNQQTNYKGSKFDLIDNKGANNRNTWKGMAGINGFNTILKDRLTAEYRFFWMQAFSTPIDYAYLIDLTLEFKINKRFSLQANYLHTFENIESKGVLPYEAQLTYGLSVTL